MKFYVNCQVTSNDDTLFVCVYGMLSDGGYHIEYISVSPVEYSNSSIELEKILLEFNNLRISSHNNKVRGILRLKKIFLKCSYILTSAKKGIGIFP